MSLQLETPQPIVRQESGKDPNDQFILSVLVKRTYTLTSDGECVVADEQLPLTEEPEFDPDNPALLVQDTDLFPFKPRTDVVVKGHAYNHGNEPEFYAAVRVGERWKQVLVMGDRRCALGTTGAIVFSAPEPVDRVPLSYTHAYGGRDAIAEAAALDEYRAKGPALPPEMLPGGDGSPFLYPRNPAGCGYLINKTAHAVESLELPNLEDPLDRLAPERLEVGSTLRWPRMPLPHATGWVSYEWFPRVVGFGILPPYEGMEIPFAEVARHYVPDSVLRPARYDQADPFHLTCGASLGLQLPHLRGDEPVALQNMHPARRDFTFSLPSDAPRIWTDGRKGKLNATDPVVHTVLIEPDENRVSVVWRGAAAALRPYLPEELARMPFRVVW